MPRGDRIGPGRGFGGSGRGWRNQGVENLSQFASGGAGVQSTQSVAESGAGTVLTGNVGPNAYRALQAANIAVITGVTGTISEVVEKFLKGEYSPSDQPTVQPHFGMK